MDEIKLIKEIEEAIHNGIYDEFLYKIELKLRELFSKYTTEDVLTLINRTRKTHNYIIYKLGYLASKVIVIKIICLTLEY